ncbi:sperm-egg fusion protein TMEM95 isoform X3 [Dendropsophus ebraccatus]|uniref:sperm-egg fusion protein TMEM95 isoform X3 n=1 Tax=Dendropsophus ebraccatus TaxID=150705 RepID=UPI003831D267
MTREMWRLRLLSLLLLLPLVSGCVFCLRQDRNLKKRFEKLCEYYKMVKRSRSCSRHPGPNSFHLYGVDEGAMLFITEKTHRVFRVLEITRDRLGIAAYWDWLHEVKLMEYTKEALCPPVCRTRTMYESVRLLLLCSLLSLPVGIIICCCEYVRRSASSEDQC